MPKRRKGVPLICEREDSMPYHNHVDDDFLRANLLSGSITLIHGLPLFHLVGPAGPNLHLEKPNQDESGFHPRTIRTSIEGSKQLTATVPAAPGALYVEPPSGPKNSVRFRVLPFPPRPFFPAEFKDNKGPKMAFFRG